MTYDMYLNMNFIHPFIYNVLGDKRGFLALGMKIREYYIKWVATEEPHHIEDAIPLISQFVGLCWKKLFGTKVMDQDTMDPVAYKVITKFTAQVLPTEYSFAHWLRVLVRRSLIRAAYKTYVPDVGDKSIRDFSYHPFMSPEDIEHSIFISEMKELLLDHITNNTRFEEDKRNACRYLAELLMEEKMPSPLVLKDKFGIPYKDQQFYMDFTTVVLRAELYKLRASIPHLYGVEREPFIAVLSDDDECEEACKAEEDNAVCDL